MPESEVYKSPNQTGFSVKGGNNLDWGMKHRLSRIFNAKSGRALIFTYENGCKSPPGLELDLLIPKLISNIDALLCSRGALRTCVPPETGKAVILRMNCLPPIPGEDRQQTVLTADIEDAIRLNADCVMVQTVIGADGQVDGMDALTKAVNCGLRCGLPVMGVVTAGKVVERTSRIVKPAVRMLAEQGANIVGSFYCEDFEEVCLACPVPVVVTGGKKVSEDEALTLVYQAVISGACGIAFGRNIYQSMYPVEMAAALSKIIHDGFTDKEARQFFRELINR